MSREKKPHTGRRRRGRLKEKKKKDFFASLWHPNIFSFICSERLLGFLVACRMCVCVYFASLVVCVCVSLFSFADEGTFRLRS